MVPLVGSIGRDLVWSYVCGLGRVRNITLTVGAFAP